MVSTLDGRTRSGARDQAILLVGFSTGMRCSELAIMAQASTTLEAVMVTGNFGGSVVGQIFEEV